MKLTKTKRILSVLLLVGSFSYAESIEYTTYVTVQKSIPEYEEVVIREPYQDCWDEEVPVTVYDEPVSNYRQADTTAAAIIGGVAGGILGHQVVHSKKAKGAATIGGAILGTLAGQNMAAGGAYAQPPRRAYTRYESRRRCTTRYHKKHVREFRGYRNVARYKGRKIVKYSDRPLKRIPLTVIVRY